MTAPDPTAGEHDFLPVNGHPDDDECTHRADGTDATYCGRPKADHEHHPNCYQNTGVPDDLPAGICDCRVLRMLDDASPPAVAASTGTSEDVEALAEALWDAMPAHHVGWRGLDGQSREFYRGNAERLLTSDWLAAREAAARAEAWEALIVLDGLLHRWETAPSLRRATAAAEVRRTLGEHLARIAREGQ